MAKEKDYFLSQRELSDFLKVSVQTLVKWNLTVYDRKGTKKFFSLREAVQKKINNMQNQFRGESLTEARTRREAAQADKIELEIKKMNGKLVDINLLSFIVCDMIGKARSKMLALPNRIYQLTADSSNEKENHKIILAGVNDCLQDLHDSIDINDYAFDDSEADSESDKYNKADSEATKRINRKRVGK